MICDVCDYYSGDDYCWREPGIAKCPLARTCQHFKYQDLCEKAVELERAAERARCAQVCADRAARLRATADKYPAGTAACFAEEALECERQIRGKQ